MACFHPLARRFFPKTRSLRPRSRLLTGLLNIASQSSHHQSLQLPQEKQKSPTKGRDGVPTTKKFMIAALGWQYWKKESQDSRKAWEEISKALNERQGLKNRRPVPAQSLAFEEPVERKEGLEFFRAWNIIKSWQSGFKYHLCRASATSVTPVV